MPLRNQDRPSLGRTFALILGPDFRFGYAAIVYGVAIALLTLALPISVQVLIETVANTTVVQSVVVLAVVLFVLLVASGILVATQVHTLEMFERRFFTRAAAEASLRLLHAHYPSLERVNRDDLMNRFFEITTLQKNLPKLLIGGLPLVLQAVIGFAVVSFYHPLFFGFSLVYILLAYIIWRSFDRRAMTSAIDVSRAKHAMADWLETLARINPLFKSQSGFDFALARTQQMSGRYIDAHRRHFRFTFAQALGFLLLYALGSAALLGIGGWLVIEGQLSLGQLVAAELILSVVFAGLSRADYYLEMYYEVGAATAKLSELWEIPIEDETGADARVEEPAASLALADVVCRYRGREYELELTLPRAGAVFLAPREAVIGRMLVELLQHYREPDSGSVTLGGTPLRELDGRVLRQQIVVVESTLVPECSIAEFLAIGDPDASRGRMREVLDHVGLSEVIAAIEGGLDRVLTPYGYPLSVAEMVRLRLAQAMLLKPRVIVLTPLFDILTYYQRARIVEALRKRTVTAVLCISYRRDLAGFQRYGSIAAGETDWFEDLEALRAHEAGLPDRRPAEDRPRLAREVRDE